MAVDLSRFRDVLLAEHGDAWNPSVAPPIPMPIAPPTSTPALSHTARSRRHSNAAST